MSSNEDPFGSGDRTIIRPGRASKPAGEKPKSGNVERAPAEATVFDPGIAQSPPPGWSSGTVIYQGAPFTENAVTEGGPREDFANSSIDPQAQKISQDVVLNASDNVSYIAANPIITAAAPLLMLLGHLRLNISDIDAEPLATRLADKIEEFEQKIADAGVASEDARIAKFVLCETADDIVLNLPGLDKEAWTKQGMLARFFQVGTPGAGFFKALNKTLADPEAHPDLLELMHACLCLGFEGQYRSLARDDSNLERVRQDVYETLRYFNSRPDDEISPRWQGLSSAMTRTSLRVPLWSVAALALALVTGAFFAMRVLITNEGDALADELLALNPSTPVIIERASFVPLIEEVKVTTTQIERVRAALAKEIDSGGLTVGTKGDFIIVEVNNLVLFQSGKADLKPEFDPIAARIVTALEPEPGSIKIVGHTDNVKPRKSSTFKSNYDLSVARAKAVEKVIASKIGDPSRIAVEGKGEDEPIADNATPEGRARNRRVDLMIPREETL